jgi:hypothetical protein
MKLWTGISALAACTILGFPVTANAAAYYLVATTIQGANTKIDISATTTWNFTVTQDFDLGGGALVMKDGPQTSEQLYLTLFDYTVPSLTPSVPGPVGATSCTSYDTASQECMTNQQFHDEVDPTTHSNNDQSYSAQYLFFGATTYIATNNVSPMTPFHLLAGHTYALELTSSEPTNSAYFIKGSPDTSGWGFVSDPSCAQGPSCTSDLPQGSINGDVGASAVDSSVPEPGTWFSLLTGAGCLLAIHRRRQQASR